MASTIDWALIRRTVWSRGGVAAILMAPNALPISFWFFETVSPIRYTFDTNDLPGFIGQLILALLVGIFAAIAGLAIDIGIVKIAVSEPTHQNRFKSLTFWVPVAFCVMAWLVIYDYYSAHTWTWDMSTFTHLAYPTASMLTALYWSWSKDWVKEMTGPLNAQIETLNAQLSEWFERFNAKVSEATIQLQAQVEDLQRRLEIQTNRATEFETLGKGLGSIVNQTLDQNAELFAQMRTQHAANLEQQRIGFEQRLQAERAEMEQRMQATVERIGQEQKQRADNLQVQLIAEQGRRGEEATSFQATIQQLETTIRELQAKQVEPASFRFLTMKEAIEYHLQGQPDRLTNDQLITELGIKADQLGTFRSQVSQVRASLSKSPAANAA